MRGLRAVLQVGVAAALAACGGQGPDALALVNDGMLDTASWSRFPSEGDGLLVPAPADDPAHRGGMRLGADERGPAHPASVLASPRFHCNASASPGTACGLRFTLATELHDGERVRVSLRSTAGPPDSRVTRVVYGWVDTFAATRTYALSISPCGSEVWISFAWDTGDDGSRVESRAFLSDVRTECQALGETNFGPGITGTLYDEQGRELPRHPLPQVLR